MVPTWTDRQLHQRIDRLVQILDLPAGELVDVAELTFHLAKVNGLRVQEELRKEKSNDR